MKGENGGLEVEVRRKSAQRSEDPAGGGVQPDQADRRPWPPPWMPTPAQAWTPAAAASIEADADDPVAQPGGGGAHPDVQAAVAPALRAPRPRDAAGHRAAIEVMTATVRRLAAARPG